jgi:hypothetical protein
MRFVFLTVSAAVTLLSLQAFLSAFDAVVLGDGSFAFVHALLDDLLRIPHLPAEPTVATGAGAGTAGKTGAAGSALASTGQGLALGLRNRLGLLLNPGGSASAGAPAQPSLPQYAPPAYGAPGTSQQYYSPLQPQRPPSPQQAPQKSYMEFTSEY